MRRYQAVRPTPGPDVMAKAVQRHNQLELEELFEGVELPRH
jgi:hypothetical protein